MYLLSVKKEGNTTTPPIYSNVLPLTVRAPVGMDDNPSYGTGIDQPLGQVHLSTSSPHVKVAEEIQISLLPILPDYLDENMLSEIALSLYYSDNGIDWYLYKKIEPVASLQEITIPFVPDHTGYIYFRAVLAYASEKISEETLVIPVLEDT
jgi:hypothetical protein